MDIKDLLRKKPQKTENPQSNFDKTQKYFMDSVKELVPGSSRSYNYGGGEFTWSFNYREIPGFRNLVSISINYSTNTPDYSPIQKNPWRIWFNDNESCGQYGQTVEADTLQEAWNLILAFAQQNP